MIHYVTFYSYKGGVGRTLALVNTAYALAARGKKVLIWDLDLEAPSLLRLPQFSELRTRVTGGTVDLLAIPEENLRQQTAKYIVPADRGISLLPAGTDDEKYDSQYLSLPVDELFGPDTAVASRRLELARQAIEELPEKTRPDIVLIDSRTGLTDLSAICTVQLPHTVVLVFTMNHQGAAGARRMLSNIVGASERLRKKQPVTTLLLASIVPTEQDIKLVDERRAQLKEMDLAPDFEIPFRRALLLNDEVYSANQADPEMSARFGQIADRLITLAPGRAEVVKFTLEVSPDSRHERGRKFEDKVATVLRLMDLEVVTFVDVGGEHMAAHGKAGLQDIDYIVECREGGKLLAAADLAPLMHRLLVLTGNEKPWAKGLLVATGGFSTEARTAAGNDILLKTYGELLDQLIDLGPYNANLINNVAGQPIERLYVEQVVVPDVVGSNDKPKPTPVSSYIESWLADPESAFLTILGDYGTGKTCLTRMLAYREAQRFRDTPSTRRQPIRIDLRTVSKAFDLESILFSHLQEATGRAINPKAFLHLLEEGRFLLIFDGFDEMATQGDWNVTLENFRQLTRAAVGKAKVLLTCRTHYFRDQSYVQELIEGRRPDASDRGTELYREIATRRGYRLAFLPVFSENQTRQYIEKACGDRAAEVLDIVDREPGLKEIARRPILLEMIVKSAPELAKLGGEITTARLYETYTADWFQREDWRLRVTHDNRRELVEALAVRLWREPDARLHFTALREVIEPLLKDRAFTVRDLEDADREIRTATFLTRDSSGNYGFAHRSFLEFFLASWIRRRIEEGNLADALRHPLLTPPVMRFLEELTGPYLCDDASRAVLTDTYTLEASENALLLYKRNAKQSVHQANLQGARLAGFQLAGINLPAANFAKADLSQADLTNVHLVGASFEDANLERAVLFHANAAGANFARANLQGADLEDANLNVADFSSADLQFANLLNAETNRTIWDGSKRFGATEQNPPRQPGIPVGFLVSQGPNQIATHPTLPLIAIASDAGISIIDAEWGRLRRYLPHPGATSVAWDASGRRLASGSDDHTVRVWDAEQGQCLRTLEGHTNGVSSVAWDASGRRLASGSYDKTVRVWDAEQGQCLRTLEGHTNGVLSVAWEASGRRLASGSSDKTVRVWDAEQGQCLRTLEGHTNLVLSVAWEASGRRLASGSSDKTVRVWDAEQGQCLRTLEGHTNGVGSVAWEASGRRLASGSYDKTVRVWDAEQGQCLRTLEGHTNLVLSVAWEASGRRLASGSYDKTVRVWDAEQGQCLRTLEGHTNGVGSVAWDASGRRLASGSYDKTVRVWDAEQGQCLRTLEGHTNLVLSVAWEASGRRLASGSSDKTVRVWDAEQGQCLRTLEGHTNGVGSVAWEASGRRLASGSYDKTVRVWDAEQGQCLRTLEGHTNLVLSVAWEASGRRLASGSSDKTVRVWDAEQGQCLRTLEGHTNLVLSVAWEASGRRLASGSSDKTVRVWDAEQGQCLRTLEGHSNWVTSVAWDALGHRLASGSYDNTVRVWDAEQGYCLRTLEGHTNGVTSVAWDASGQRLASGSNDNTVRIWDVETGHCIWVIHLLPENGWLALRHDGKFHGNEAGKRHFMFADGWALYPARAFPAWEIKDTDL